MSLNPQWAKHTTMRWVIWPLTPIITWVLMVDDHHDPRSELTQVLEPNGCRLLDTDNGEDATRCPRQIQPDLLQMGLDVPLLTGAKSGSKLRLMCPFLVAIGCALLIAISGSSARAQSAKAPPLPPPTGYVNDYANVIDAQTKSRLETVLTNLKQRANIEIAIVTVPTTNGEDIFDYSLAVARGWGIGSKGDDKAGLLLLVAINDRKYFTQVSDRLEGDLPDGLVGQIQRERLVPQLQKGDYGQGIYDTVQTYLATLAEKRGFNIEGIEQRYAYRGGTAGPFTTGQMVWTVLIVIFIAIFFIVIFVLSSKRKGGGGGGGGWWNVLLAAFVFSSLGRGGPFKQWLGRRRIWGRWWRRFRWLWWWWQLWRRRRGR